VLLGKKIVQRVAIIALIGNQSFRLLGHEAVLDRSLDQLLLMRRSARNPEGERKTMAVCDCPELGPFADERSTNAIAPFFAPMKEASINVSSRPSCPRANKSSANAQRMPSSTPARCQRWKRRWQVWYRPYRAGRSCHGAPVSQHPQHAVQHLPCFPPGSAPVVGTALLSKLHQGPNPFPLHVGEIRHALSHTTTKEAVFWVLGSGYWVLANGYCSARKLFPRHDRRP
jgi:hypothetical protein